MMLLIQRDPFSKPQTQCPRMRLPLKPTSLTYHISKHEHKSKRLSTHCFKDFPRLAANTHTQLHSSSLLLYSVSLSLSLVLSLSLATQNRSGCITAFQIPRSGRTVPLSFRLPGARSISKDWISPYAPEYGRVRWFGMRTP